jgi:excisionase family DNA binding protein
MAEKKNGTMVLNMFNKYPDVLTVKQVAEALGIGENKAYELVNDRVIGNKRVGRRILVPKCCLIDYTQSALYNVIA